MKKYECTKCGWIYDNDLGDLSADIEPGTSFISISDSWQCPRCGEPKQTFKQKSYYEGSVEEWEYPKHNL